MSFVPTDQFGQYVVAGVDTYNGLLKRYIERYDDANHFGDDEDCQ